jgi:tetratricopeptide (TPR) repeat protein
MEDLALKAVIAVNKKLEGNAAFKKGDLEEAKKLYGEAIDNLELNFTPDGKDLYCATHCNVALIHIKGKKYDDALNNINESLGKVEDHTKTLFRRA